MAQIHSKITRSGCDSCCLLSHARKRPAGPRASPHRVSITYKSSSEKVARDPPGSRETRASEGAERDTPGKPTGKEFRESIR